MSARVEHGFELRGPVTPVRKLLRDMWRSRSLLRMLSRRDFYVRYRRPSFGVLWAVGLPLLNAVVLSIVFSLIVRIRVGVNYPTFVMAAVLPWTFFSGTLSSASTSITGGSSIASKVYFPRALLPLVTMLANFYGFVPGIALLVGVAVYNHVSLGLSLLMLVPAVLALLAITGAFSLVFAALQVYFRDVSFIVTASLQAWFYASAIVYPLSAVPKGLLRAIIEINPMTGVIHLFRMAVFGMAPPALTLFSIVGWVVGLLIAAALLYRRFDRVFVDLL
jgi:lipopolysaccharide transport system permease protein